MKIILKFFSSCTDIRTDKQFFRALHVLLCFFFMIRNYWAHNYFFSWNWNMYINVFQFHEKIIHRMHDNNNIITIIFKLHNYNNYNNLVTVSIIILFCFEGRYREGKTFVTGYYYFFFLYWNCNNLYNIMNLIIKKVQLKLDKNIIIFILLFVFKKGKIL